MESHHCAFEISVVKVLSRLYDADINDRRFYVAIFSALDWADSLCFVACTSKWVTVAFFLFFFKRVLNIVIGKWCTQLQICLVVTWLVPREAAAVSACSVFTVKPCTMSRHFMQGQIHRAHAPCFCSLPPAFLAEWPGSFAGVPLRYHTGMPNGYRNNSTESWLCTEKKILPQLLPGLEPATFRSVTSRYGALTTELSPLPKGAWFLSRGCYRFSGNDLGP